MVDIPIAYLGNIQAWKKIKQLLIVSDKVAPDWTRTWNLTIVAKYAKVRIGG